MVRSIAEALEVKRRVEDHLLALPGVHTVDFGGKLRGRRPTGEFAIRVLVSKKKPESQVPPHELIPEEIDGVKTDVVEAGIPIQYILEGGIELSFESQLAGQISLEEGTLGCFAWRQDTLAVPPPRAVLLSNDHVLYGRGFRRHDGDLVKLTSCSGCCGEVIAFLLRTSGPDSSFVDAAIAELDTGVKWRPRIHDVSITGTLDLRPDNLENLHPAIQSAIANYTLIVKKYGAATSLTVGAIIGVAASTLTRREQLQVWPVNSDYFSKPGDSGSVIYIDNSRDNNSDVVQQIFGHAPIKSPNLAKIVALLWGGDPIDDDSIEKKRTVSSHIDTVTELLEIKIATNPPEVVYEVDGEPRPHPALARLYGDLSGTERAREFVALYGKYSEEIRNLLRHSRPFIVTWHRSHGPQMVRALIDVAENRAPFLPVEFEGQRWADCVQQVARALLEVGSPPLRADVMRYLSLATRLGGRSYAEVLGFLVVLDETPAAAATEPSQGS